MSRSLLIIQNSKLNIEEEEDKENLLQRKKKINRLSQEQVRPQEIQIYIDIAPSSSVRPSKQQERVIDC